VETTEGGYFNRQHRNTYRTNAGNLSVRSCELLGITQIKAGVNYSHNSYDGRATYCLSTSLHLGIHDSTDSVWTGVELQRRPGRNRMVCFGQMDAAEAGDVDYGIRLDHDSVTNATNAAPRAAVAIALTHDNKTLLKAGGGIFYDRVPLNIPIFPLLPDRTILGFNGDGQVAASSHYVNLLGPGLRNPRSTAWNVELTQLLDRLVVRVGYQQRNTGRDFVITRKRKPITHCWS